MEYTDIVYAPEGVEPTVDFVFVHGLNPLGNEDHARTTWTWEHEDGRKTFWPAELLRNEIPTARCILFAYNASVLRNVATTPLAHHARNLLDGVQNKRNGDSETHRPIIFVAHSMGGLLVKQALVEAQLDEDRYGCIKGTTYSLVFFATPHRGGNRVEFAKLTAALCSALTGQPTNSLLKSLEKESLLEELASIQFGKRMNDYDILTFFETVEMKVKVRKIAMVPQFTSTV